eukprot:1581847-Prorocentrum_lima.AAC.1
MCIRDRHLNLAIDVSDDVWEDIRQFLLLGVIRIPEAEAPTTKVEVEATVEALPDGGGGSGGGGAGGQQGDG